MTINKTTKGTVLTIKLEGSLDTITSPELETVLEQNLDGKDSLIFDLSKLEYVSSAGLRVLLKAQKTMNSQGQMKVKNLSEEVREIMEITGFVDIFTIE